jgi:hypothetical protein
MVTVIELWPSRSWIAFGCAPSSIKRAAHEPRYADKLATLIPFEQGLCERVGITRTSA